MSLEQARVYCSGQPGKDGQAWVPVRPEHLFMSHRGRAGQGQAGRMARREGRGGQGQGVMEQMRMSQCRWNRQELTALAKQGR